MSEFTFYKLSFTTGVHLGTGILGSTDICFHADTLFSALYLEALREHKENQLYQAVTGERLRFSDAFPYRDKQYFIPKPMLRIASSDTGNSLEKKFYKNLKYIPAEWLSAYLNGTMERIDPMKGLYTIDSRTMANVRSEKEDTLPYQVGICSFTEGAGLYFIAETETAAEKALLEILLKGLSLTGIGGKRSAGLGKFGFDTGAPDKEIISRLQKADGKKMLLSTALPTEDELENALFGATYGLLQRSGFVLSENYAPEERKKHTLFMFDAGSCFSQTFRGDVYDVSNGGAHPVYRYAKPMFFSLGVE